MILGAMDLFIPGLFIFLAVIFLYMGVKFSRGKLDRLIHNKGLSADPDEAIKNMVSNN